jgi:hypothetical protein
MQFKVLWNLPPSCFLLFLHRHQTCSSDIPFSCPSSEITTIPVFYG